MLAVSPHSRLRIARAHRKPAGKPQLGADYKDAISKPGPWEMYMYMQAKPFRKKQIMFAGAKPKTDQWGFAAGDFRWLWRQRWKKMVKDFPGTKSGDTHARPRKNSECNWQQTTPGLDIHEMGGVRMGTWPKTSMLNQWNQLHCQNVLLRMVRAWRTPKSKPFDFVYDTNSTGVIRWKKWKNLWIEELLHQQPPCWA